jgi:hypothetical protein
MSLWHYISNLPLPLNVASVFPAWGCRVIDRSFSLYISNENTLSYGSVVGSTLSSFSVTIDFCSAAYSLFYATLSESLSFCPPS